MSKMTYTDGSYTIWAQCNCKETTCHCGSVRHFPAPDIKKIDEFSYEDLELAEMGIQDFLKILEYEDK